MGLAAAGRAPLMLPTPPKLACGVRWMLEHAIDLHRKKFYGDDPIRFELHPVTLIALSIELGPNNWYDCRDRDSGLHYYHGVEIVSSSRFTEARMVDCRHHTEPL